MNSKKFRNLFIIAFFVFTLAVNAMEESQSRIAVLYSGYTAKINENFIPKAIEQITLWEIFLMQNKIPYSVIYDKDLENGLSDNFDIIILPSVYSISEREIRSLKKFLDDGNSILNVGSKLNYDDDQNYKGLENLNELFGIKISEFSDKELSLFQYINQNPIFTDGITENLTLQISTKIPPIISEVNSNSYELIGYVKTPKSKLIQTLLTYGKAGNGKFINIGFNFDDVIGGENEQKLFKTFILNSIKWLDKAPDIYVADFPDNFITGSLVIIEYKSGLNFDVIDKLKNYGIKPYFLISPQQSIDDDINTKIENDHLIVDLQNLILNDDSINTELFYSKIYDIKNKLNDRINFIMLSKKQVQNNDLISFLSENGVKTFLVNQYLSGKPYLLNGNNFVIPFNENNPGEIINGEINFFTFSLKNLCDENTLNDFVNHIIEKKVDNNWFCSLNHLKDWYVLKSNIKVSISEWMGNSITITLSNNNVTEVDDLNLTVNLPGKIKPQNLSIDSDYKFVDYSIDGLNQLKLRISEIGPKQLNKVTISFHLQ